MPHQIPQLRAFSLKFLTRQVTRLTPRGTQLQIVAVLSAAAPEFRGSRSRHPIVALCAVALIAAAAPTAFAGNEPAVVETESTQLRAWAGPSKPPFMLKDANGRQVRLDPASGSITVVHFFATWCEPCRAELPALDRLIA